MFYKNLVYSSVLIRPQSGHNNSIYALALICMSQGNRSSHDLIYNEVVVLSMAEDTNKKKAFFFN